MNQLTTVKSQIVQTAFEELTEEDKIVEFMISFFKNFIITRSEPNNLDFKRSIDSVNKVLLYPITQFIETHELPYKKEDERKLEIWQNAHRKFEVSIINEVVKWV